MAEVTIVPKGQSISIKEKAPSLTKLHVGAGWDTNEQENGKDFDLDLSAILLGADGKVVNKGVVYYGEKDYKVGEDNVVHHTGDNLTGAGEGDDEVIEFLLDKVPAEVARIALLVNIYEASERGQNFGMVKNSFVRLVDSGTGAEFARHDLAAEYASNTGVIVAEFVRENGEWQFKATAEGTNGSIEQIMTSRGYK